MKTLLEMNHYICAVTLLLFPLSGYPNSHQYFQYLDSLLFQYLPSLYSVVKQIILTLNLEILLFFPIQLMLFEYCTGSLLLGHLV
jgi:hypothetical protein